MVLSGKALGFKVLFKEIVLQQLRILGLTHRRASPVLSHLASFIHWSCACAQLVCKVGENYYFQTFLPEVAWSRREPRDRMLEFYSWPSHAPSFSKIYSPFPTTPLCWYGRIRDISKANKTDEKRRVFRKWFSQRDFDPPNPWPPGWTVLLLLAQVIYHNCLCWYNKEEFS